MPRTVVIVQARMGSSRLPQKVMLPVGGRPLLEHLLLRLNRAQKPDAVMIATSDKTGDDAIAEFALKQNSPCYRGSESDVLARYFHAAQQIDAEHIVRVTADCPMLDPATIDAAILQFEKSGCDYISTGIAPITYPNGLGCEVFTFSALERAHTETQDPWHREHVTTYIKEPDAGFRCEGIGLDRSYAHIRLTVDTAEDYQAVKRAIEALIQDNPEYTLDDILSFVNAHPEVLDINRLIQQKTRENETT